MLKIDAKYVQGTNTVLSVSDSDPSIALFYNAVIDGDHTAKSDAELLELAKDWYINRYVTEYALQKVTELAKETKENSAKALETVETIAPRFEKVWEHFVTIEKTAEDVANENIVEPTPTPKEELHVDTPEEKEVIAKQKEESSDDDEVVIED